MDILSSRLGRFSLTLLISHSSLHLSSRPRIMVNPSYHVSYPTAAVLVFNVQPCPFTIDTIFFYIPDFEALEIQTSVQVGRCKLTVDLITNNTARDGALSDN